MVKPDSPFGLKLKPSLAPWLARYLRASTARRAAEGEALQRGLCGESLGVFRELAAEGIDGGFDEPGCLTVHTSADAEAHAAAEAASETGRALGARVLTGDEARELEPSLTARVRAAVLFPGEARCDPVRLSAAVGAAAEARGVRLRTGVEAYAVGGDGVVETTRGRSGPGRSWSRRAHGRAGWPGPPACGSRSRAARATPRSGTRRPRRCGCRSTCTTSASSPTRWATARGSRAGCCSTGSTSPSTTAACGRSPPRPRTCSACARSRGSPGAACARARPTGCPVIGAANGVVFATGHGMLGVTLAPLTGRLRGLVVAGAATHPALPRLSPERF